MAQTPPTRATEWPSEGRSALILSMITAGVFGLLAGCGARLNGSWLSEHLEFGWAYTALAWASVTLAPALAWTFVGLAVLVGGIALRTRGFRSGPWPPEFVLTAVLMIPIYALVLVALLFFGPFAVELLTWVASFLDNCPPGEYCPTF
ncbi:hypothetical protein SK571_43330 [Lentzea sp. BCCO 10_0798]|uniref:Uncharacterized protein n=1 Tax=Lentzea kristufekii TaxID=3095430 RepID=A0ABU4U7R4_9PSEU|nr:hypothetical protein [Lentzea sp. BCCO 10_0798]MDX8056249.1 hypothetical protein [Lentzea sp. BCCO 10_0798]